MYPGGTKVVKKLQKNAKINIHSESTIKRKKKTISEYTTKSWQQFTPTIIPETPIKTAWNKINSIKGK